MFAPPVSNRWPARRRPLRAGWLALLLVGANAPAAQEWEVPAEGGRAGRDYVAPASFDVIDVEATVAIATAAGETPPLVIRPAPEAVANVVGEFDAAFRNTRKAYLDALEAAFGSREIGSREINSSRFRSFRTEFQAANALFPVNLVLAQSWAKGYDAESTRERLAQALRATMTRGLIGDARPASTVFVSSLGPGDRIRSWNEASSHCRAINRSEITSVDAAGQELRQSLDVLDRGAGGFMTGLLRANFAEDEFLTSLLLDERLGSKVSKRSFRAGEYIVRSGDVLDRAGRLALEQLARLGLVPLEAPPPAPAPAARPDQPAEPAPTSLDREQGDELLPGVPNRPWVYAVLGTVAGVVLLSVVVLVRRARHVHRAATTEQWLDEPAVKPAGNMREALIPHLARELKNKLVQVLFAQRQELLHNEASASERVRVLEERLAKLQPAIAERIRGYEKRIQALEAELEEKDQETRDLIRAKLVLARKELDAEISRHHINWN